MDLLPNKLDFLITHWSTFPRKYPAMFPLVHCDYMGGKTEWVRRRFQSCNFSLILNGRGEFHRAGRVWPVKAPCVLTQWPGEHVEYGPADGESWDELYLIYDAQLLPRFRTAGFIDLRRPVWPISHPPAVGKRIADLHALSHSDSPENAADRADRTAEWLILETHSPPPVSRIDAGILRASEEIRNNPAGPVDFSALAKRCGMSLSTFRRRWQHAFGMPPGQSLLQLRMHEACRLLTETRLPVGEVARLSGFDDEFYFSRRFRLRLQATPTKYRQLFHSRPS